MSTAATPVCAVIRPGETYEGKQGLAFVAGISAETVGATGICMHLVTIPPDRQAKAHLHAAHETAFYVLHGALEMQVGARLADRLTVRAGEFLYIPAGMPHRPTTLSATEPCLAVVARTDPNEQESVVVLPQLERQSGDGSESLPSAADRRRDDRYAPQPDAARGLDAYDEVRARVARYRGISLCAIALIRSTPSMLAKVYAASKA